MKKLILNNKSYLTLEDVLIYKEKLKNIKSEKLDIIIFPNIIYLSLFDNFKYSVGTQNFYSYNAGNYTGEVNLESLKKLNVNYTMLNHSERRINGLDSKELIKEKVFKSLKANFNTILIVGEKEYTKDPFKHIKKELDYYLKDIESDKIKCLSIMYEPSWLDDCQDINIIRKIIIDIKEYFINKYKEEIEVYYGIGVDEKNANDILEFTDGIGIGKKSIDIKFINKIIDKLS